MNHEYGYPISNGRLVVRLVRGVHTEPVKMTRAAADRHDAREKARPEVTLQRCRVIVNRYDRTPDGKALRRKLRSGR